MIAHTHTQNFEVIMFVLLDYLHYIYIYILILEMHTSINFKKLIIMFIKLGLFHVPKTLLFSIYTYKRLYIHIYVYMYVYRETSI